MNKQSPGSTATVIQTFLVDVFSPDMRLYNNGLCQVMLLVEIVADMQLSPSEIATLRIVDGITKLEIPMVDSSLPVPARTWGASKERNLYDFHPGTRKAARDSSRAGEFFQFYVQTADQSNARKRLAASIELDSGLKVYSTDVSGSDSYVEVLAVEASPQPISAWETQWNDSMKFDVADGKSVTVYFLGLTVNGASREIRDIQVGEDGYASAFRWLAVSAKTGAFCGFAAPPTDDQRVQSFTYSQPQFIGTYRLDNNESPRTGCAAVAFIHDLKLGNYQSAANGPHITYQMRDQYGTLSRVRLSITEKCDEMQLSLAADDGSSLDGQ
ncbi:hypothetical protein PAQ31011_03275 [Pandoraea aquatica]|uniref:Uncharacterized protein n=1 Tax=Pandoraea aquatica TaxID=2508290 RepID=A0A5E4WFA0_9BURK|nr:hypothetical protein [Pandoraea aquatica]VVE23308.1 hypothetical protein PAQ31011_03275 [Pandoraea aquatica]